MKCISIFVFLAAWLVAAGSSGQTAIVQFSGSLSYWTGATTGSGCLSIGSVWNGVEDLGGMRPLDCTGIANDSAHSFHGNLGWVAGQGGGVGVNGEFLVHLDIPASISPPQINVEGRSEALRGLPIWPSPDTTVPWYLAHSFTTHVEVRDAISGAIRTDLPPRFQFSVVLGNGFGSDAVLDTGNVALTTTQDFRDYRSLVLTCAPNCLNASRINGIWAFSFPSSPEPYSVEIRVSGDGTLSDTQPLPEPGEVASITAGVLALATLIRPSRSRVGRGHYK